MTDAPKHREGNAQREGEAPAEPLQRVPASRLRRSVALPDERLALPARKHPVHGIKYVDGQPTIIFDTLCTKHRRAVLACDAFHHVFRDVAANATAWLLGRYVIMPDHVHFFAADVGSEIEYENWVTYLKSQLTRTMGGRGSRRAAAPREDSTARQEPRPPKSAAAPDGDAAARQEPRPPERVDAASFRWLSDHWDCRVRNADAYEEKWQYFLNNPVRNGLVAHPEDWPYQGEIFELRWR